MSQTIGQVRDFYRPTATNDLCGMLGSFTQHQWSNTAGGPYVTPAYYNSLQGGSALNWPLSVSDGRQYLGFWGGLAGSSGCCHTTSNTYGEAPDAAAWGRAFTLHIREP